MRLRSYILRKQWPTMAKCREFMRKYAISKKFEYKQVQNNNIKINLKCKDPDCSWRVYVRRMPGEHTAKLKSSEAQHTCKCDEKCKNSMAHAGWVANEIEKLLRNHKQFRPRDVQAEMWEKYGVKISYWIAWSANIKCHERIYGSYNEGYRLCPELVRQILTKNSGSAHSGLDVLLTTSLYHLLLHTRHL